MQALQGEREIAVFRNSMGRYPEVSPGSHSGVSGGFRGFQGVSVGFRVFQVVSGVLQAVSDVPEGLRALLKPLGTPFYELFGNFLKVPLAASQMPRSNT